MRDVTNDGLMFAHLRPAARWRLFCFHHAGGGASTYRRWVDELPPEIGVCAVQLPGRETRFREACITRLEPLVEKLADVLAPRTELPFAFFGHSMGALVAFELARELRRRGARGPFHLGVSGSVAPQLRRRPRPAADMTDAQLVEQSRQLGGMPEEVAREPELLALVLPILRADYGVVDNYVYAPAPPLPCPISAFLGRSDPLTTEEGVAAWRQETTGAFTLHAFPGDHFFVNTARAEVQRALSHDLLRSCPL